MLFKCRRSFLLSNGPTVIYIFCIFSMKPERGRGGGRRNIKVVRISA
jgi:hypothetical protein